MKSAARVVARGSGGSAHLTITSMRPVANPGRAGPGRPRSLWQHRESPTTVESMSLPSVRTFIAARAPEIEILEATSSTATVALAAAAHGIEPDRIAKTLSLWLDGEPILIVMSGESRLDNRKFKARFGAKARMLGADEVLEATSHPVGGVCPFGLPRPLKVYADVSLRTFDVVLPAAGDTHHALRIAPERLVELSGAEWIDVAEERRAP